MSINKHLETLQGVLNGESAGYKQIELAMNRTCLVNWSGKGVCDIGEELKNERRRACR